MKAGRFSFFVRQTFQCHASNVFDYQKSQPASDGVMRKVKPVKAVADEPDPEVTASDKFQERRMPELHEFDHTRRSENAGGNNEGVLLPWEEEQHHKAPEHFI